MPMTSPAPQIGEAISRMGEVMEKAAVRIQNRTDAIETARTYRDYYETSMQELTRRSTEEDFSRTEAVKSYADFLQEKKNEALQNYKGSADGMAELDNRIEAQRMNLFSQAAVMSNTQQRQTVKNFITRDTDSLAADVRKDSLNFKQSIVRINDSIASMSGALDSTEQETLLADSYKTILTSGVFGALERGDIKAAEDMLNSPEMGMIVGEDTQLNLWNSVKSVQKSGSGKTAVDDWERGRTLARFINPGREPTEQEIANVLKLSTDPELGKMSGDKDVDFLSGNLTAYMNDILPPREKAAFELKLTENITKTDPYNGQTYQIDPGPEFSRAVQKMKGRKPAPAPSPAPSNAAVDVNEINRITSSINDPAEKTKVEQRLNIANQPAAKQQQTLEEMGIFGAIQLVSGPMDFISRKVADSLLGGLITSKDAELKQRSYQFIQAHENELFNALSIDSNGDINNSERKDLESKFSLLGTGELLTSSEKAPINKLIGRNEAFKQMLENYRKIADDTTSPGLLRKDAERKANALQKYLIVERMPPQPKNREELLKMYHEGKIQPGSFVITPQGELMRFKP